jgi:hypothetical protein
MFYPCRKGDGYGMVIEIHSSDHGIIGNTDSPVHAHLLTVEGREIGEFEITEDAPARSNEIRWYRTNSIPDGYGEKIVKWVNSESRYVRINKWILLKDFWERREP